MRQTYKKKPEYLDVVKVNEDKDSIQELVEFLGVSIEDVSVKYDLNWNRIIIIGDLTISTGQIVFKDKNDKSVVIDEDKLLKFYDLYSDNYTIATSGNLIEE